MRDDCRRVRSLLGAYADSELGPEQAGLVSEHVGACPECRRELGEVLALHQLVKQAGPPKPHEDYWDWHRTRVWHRLRRERPERQRFFRPTFVWPKLATLAGGLVVVLVVVVVGWQFVRPGLVGSRRAVQVVTGVPVAGASADKVEAERAAGVQERDQVQGEKRPSGDLTPAPILATEQDCLSKRDDATAGRLIAGDERAEPSVVATAAKAAEPEQARGTESVRGAASEERPATGRSGWGRIVQGLVEAPPQEKPGAPAPGEGASRGKASLETARPELVSLPPLPRVGDNETGTVLLTLVTDTLGAVITAKLARSSGLARLDSIAVNTLLKARFSPGLKDGRRVQSVVQYPVRFAPAKTTPKKPQK